MRHKIGEGTKKEDTMKFLFMPRYCAKCHTAFWLEKIMFYWSGSWWSPRPCPLCGGDLWSTKDSAQSR